MNTNITANGNSDPIEIQGSYTLFLRGAFDGATIKAQISPTADGTFVDIADGSFTANGQTNLSNVAKSFLRYNTVSAGASTDVDATLITLRIV